MTQFSRTLFRRYRGRVPDFRVETIGSEPRVILVPSKRLHRCRDAGAQRALAARFTLVSVERSGDPRTTPLARIEPAIETPTDLRDSLPDGLPLAGVRLELPDRLSQRLPARRAVLPGAGDIVQRAPASGETLAAFLQAA
jgi:hypothetical protein